MNYDISPLKHGFLYDGTALVRVSRLLLPIFLIGALLPLAFAAGHKGSSVLPILVNAFQGAVFLFVFGGAFMAFVRGRLYKRALQTFELKNNLQPLAQADLLPYVPQNLQMPGAYGFKTYGYKFTLGTTPALVFDCSFSVGSGKYKRTYHYAIACLVLPKQYPHLYLDGKANGKYSQYQDNQKVALEGDFNNYFTLYMPEGSAAGALTVLSPDVMQTVIDQGKALDLEINGNFAASSTVGNAFTRENFLRLINCSKALATELNQLNVSWQPLLKPNGQTYELKKTNNTRAIIMIAIVIIGYFVGRFYLGIVSLHQ